MVKKKRKGTYECVPKTKWLLTPNIYNLLHGFCFLFLFESEFEGSSLERPIP